MKCASITLFTVAVLFGGATISQAQDIARDGKSKSTSPAEPAGDAGGSPTLVVYFDIGSSKVRSADKAILDRASRAYNEGKPIVMIVSGSSDRVGDAHANLALSERRASAVLAALLDRGIPAERFQVLAKGETELPIPTQQGVAEARNRRVEITWR